MCKCGWVIVFNNYPWKIIALPINVINFVRKINDHFILLVSVLVETVMTLK